MLTKDKKQRLKCYRQFVSMNDSEEVIQLFEGKKLPWLLGSDRFIHWLKDKFFDQKDH